MSTRLLTRLLAAALLVPLLVLVSATGGSWLRCRMTGAWLSACCCPAEDAPTADAPAATVAGSDCCDRVVRDITPVPAEAPIRVSAPDVRVAVASVFLLPSTFDLVSAPSRVRAGQPDSLGPPTVKLRLAAKSTLLI